MANTLSVIDMVLRESLRVAHEKATFLGTINRSYDDSFCKTGAKIGSTLRVRNPNQYTRTKGSRVMDIQEIAESTQTITVATQDHVDIRLNSAELEMSFDDIAQRVVEPAVSALISGIESDVLVGLTQGVANTVGSAGTVVGASDITAIGNARAKLNQSLAPKDGNRFVQMDSVTMASVSNKLNTLFHPAAQLETAFREGFISRTAMADFYENERTWTYTAPDDIAWAIDDDAALTAYTDAAGVATLNMDTGGTNFPVGTSFTIADLYDCHPETKQKYSHLKQFVVTAIGTIGSNQGSVTFEPAIRIGGARQNCYLASGVIRDLEDNVVTIWGGTASTAYRQNIMYHKDFATFVTADLPLMGGADSCVRRVQDGFSMRVWKDGDIRNDELLMRIDMLYGYKLLRGDWACRLSN
jgi:hypothetical protein